jgi:hypothetical protein
MLVANTTDVRNAVFSLKARIHHLLWDALLEAITIGKIYVRLAPMSTNAKNAAFCCMPQSRPMHLTALWEDIINGIR